jgi:hypothetical protein
MDKIANTSPFSPKKWSREDKKRIAENLEKFLKRSPDYVTYEERKRKVTRANAKRPEEETYSPEFIKAIKDAEEEIKNGGGITFRSIKELKAYFKKMEKEKEGKKFRTLNDMEFERKKKSNKSNAKRKSKNCGCK